MTEIGNVTVTVDAVITDKQYHEAMSAVSTANKRMAELQDENAKLRTQLADVTESVGRVEERCAKLRELVRYMWDFSCVVPDEPHTSKEELDYSVEVWKRMRELGVMG